MIWMMTAALAATSVEADFDGDGKKEKVAVVDGSIALPGLDPVYTDGPELEVLDIQSDKAGRELAVCNMGPRDWRTCELFRMVGGKWSAIEMPAGLAMPQYVTAKGNGFLLGAYNETFYWRVEKMGVEGGKLTRFPQPFYATATERNPAGMSFTPDRSFPIFTAPGGTEIVANVAPKNKVVVLVESAEHRLAAESFDGRWFLLQLGSGLTGWANLPAMLTASDALAQLATMN
jgi:hypothetical protein